jgi:hypothetical protein
MALSDGTEARVRPIFPDDGPALVELHRGLSDWSRFSRFFTLHPVLRSDEVVHFTCVDGVDRVEFVAADTYQHHHIATELLRRLAHTVRRVGVSQSRLTCCPRTRQCGLCSGRRGSLCRQRISEAPST